MKDITIREGRKEDLPAVLDLIRELAEYERAPDEVEVTIDSMERDAFGSDPAFGFYIAESDEGIIGTAIYYYRYSTWKGRRLYLEDFIVNEDHRGRGIGRRLFEMMLQHAREHDCKGLSWQVREWNEQAIQFYKKYGAEFDGEWLNGSIPAHKL